MGKGRGGHSLEKHKVRGVALVSALITAVIVLIVLTGLYFLLSRLFESSEAVRTYSSAREAAVSGVNYAITTDVFDRIVYNQPCPDGNPPCPTSGSLTYNCCCTLNLKFRLKGSTNLFDNTVRVCFAGYKPPSGYPITGVAYSKLPPGNKGFIFSIISDVTDPQNVHNARIEAVYTP